MKLHADEYQGGYYLSSRLELPFCLKLSALRKAKIMIECKLLDYGNHFFITIGLALCHQEI